MCVSPCLCVHLRTISGQSRSVACSLFKCVTLYGHQLSPNTTVLGHYGNLKAGWRTPQVLLILAFTGAPFNPSTWETEAGRSKFKASLVYRSRDGRYGLHRETLKKKKKPLKVIRLSSLIFCANDWYTALIPVLWMADIVRLSGPQTHNKLGAWLGLAWLHRHILSQTHAVPLHTSQNKPRGMLCLRLSEGVHWGSAGVVDHMYSQSMRVGAALDTLSCWLQFYHSQMVTYDVLKL